MRKLRKGLAAIAVVGGLAVAAPAALPPGLPGSAAVAFANPPCGPSNDGQQINVGGNGYECTHVVNGVGAAIWFWAPV